MSTDSQMLADLKSSLSPRGHLPCAGLLIGHRIRKIRKWGHGRGRQLLSLTYAKLAKWASLPLCYITLSL